MQILNAFFLHNENNFNRFTHRHDGLHLHSAFIFEIIIKAVFAWNSFKYHIAIQIRQLIHIYFKIILQFNEKWFFTLAPHHVVAQNIRNRFEYSMMEKKNIIRTHLKIVAI